MSELKQKPNGIYYLDTEVPGPDGTLKRTRVSLETRNKADAAAQRRDWLAGVHPKHPAMGGVVAPKGAAPSSGRNGSTTAKVEGTDMRRFLAKCLSDPDVWGKVTAFKNYRSNVKVVSRLLPEDLTVEAVTAQTLMDLRDSLRAEGKAEGTVKKLVGIMGTALRAADAAGIIAGIPSIPQIKVDSKRERVISLDEERMMHECAAARREAETLTDWDAFINLMRVLSATGFRLGEALSLGPHSVKRKRWFDHQRRVHEGVWLGLPGSVTKNGKPRDVPLTPTLLALIPTLNERAKGGRWFPWKKDSSGPLYLLKKLRADAKLRGYDIDDVVLHTFRHTCATRLAEGGMDLLGLRDWLGHSDIKITAERYVHLMNGHIHRGADILEAYASSPSDQWDGEENPPNIGKDDCRVGGRDRAEAGTPALH